MNERLIFSRIWNYETDVQLNKQKMENQPSGRVSLYIHAICVYMKAHIFPAWTWDPSGKRSLILRPLCIASLRSLFFNNMQWLVVPVDLWRDMAFFFKLFPSLKFHELFFSMHKIFQECGIWYVVYLCFTSLCILNTFAKDKQREDAKYGDMLSSSSWCFGNGSFKIKDFDLKVLDNILEYVNERVHWNSIWKINPVFELALRLYKKISKRWFFADALFSSGTFYVRLLLSREAVIVVVVVIAQADQTMEVKSPNI